TSGDYESDNATHSHSDHTSATSGEGTLFVTLHHECHQLGSFSVSLFPSHTHTHTHTHPHTHTHTRTRTSTGEQFMFFWPNTKKSYMLCTVCEERSSAHV